MEGSSTFDVSTIHFCDGVGNFLISQIALLDVQQFASHAEISYRVLIKFLPLDSTSKYSFHIFPLLRAVFYFCLSSANTKFLPGEVSEARGR